MGKLPQFLRVPRCIFSLFRGDCGRQTGICAIVYAFLLYRDQRNKAVTTGELAWFTQLHRGTIRRALKRLRGAGCIDEDNGPLLRFTREEIDSFIKVDTADLRACGSAADIDKALIAPILLGDVTSFRDPEHAPKGTSSRLPIMSMLGSMIGRCAKTASKKLRGMAGLFRPELAIDVRPLPENKFRVLLAFGRDAARTLGFAPACPAPAVPRLEIPPIPKAPPMPAGVLRQPPVTRSQKLDPRNQFADTHRPDLAHGALSVIAEIVRHSAAKRC